MTRWFQLLGSELSGKAGCKVLEVLISKPKGSPDLTVDECIKACANILDCLRQLYKTLEYDPQYIGIERTKIGVPRI